MLTQLGRASQDMADQAGLAGAPRAEAQAETKVGQAAARVTGAHPGAQKNRFRLGSMNGLRKGKRSRQA